MKTQGEQVDCMARSGLYHSRPVSITSYTNELNTNMPKQTDKTQIKTLSMCYICLSFPFLSFPLICFFAISDDLRPVLSLVLLLKAINR